MSNSTQALAGTGKLDRTRIQACIILAVGLVFALGVAREWPPLNGSQKFIYWVWTWRDLGIPKTGALLLGPLLLIIGVLWRAEKMARPAIRRFP